MKCQVCGKEIEKSRYSNGIICSDKCFYKDYWLEYVRTKDNPNHVVINGTHYVVGNEANNGCFRGFGGKRFVILKNKEIIVTTNLWLQGEIPDYAKDELPNNATFLPDFWADIVQDKNTVIIIDGNVYMTGREDIEDKYKANDGQKFKIRKGNEIIVSTNLKSRGEIPSELKDLYPDNAQFL